MAEKRAAILDAAWPIFLREGWAGASLERVAAESGISKMTVYRHFGTKEELFEALVEEMCRRMEVAIEAAPAVGLSPEERLTAEARGFVAALTLPEALAFYRLIVADGWRFPVLARTFERSGMAVLRRRVSAILAEAGLNLVETAPRAAGFINLVLGDAYLEASLGLDDPDRDARFEAQIAMATHFALAGAP
jgi:AcrR family transcriptional regulator